MPVARVDKVDPAVRFVEIDERRLDLISVCLPYVRVRCVALDEDHLGPLREQVVQRRHRRHRLADGALAPTDPVDAPYAIGIVIATTSFVSFASSSRRMRRRRWPGAAGSPLPLTRRPLSDVPRILRWHEGRPPHVRLVTRSRYLCRPLATAGRRRRSWRRRHRGSHLRDDSRFRAVRLARRDHHRRLRLCRRSRRRGSGPSSGCPGLAQIRLERLDGDGEAVVVEKLRDGAGRPYPLAFTTWTSDDSIRTAVFVTSPA